MGISRLQPVSGGTDWSKYQSKSLINAVQNLGGATTSEVDFLNVTGEGFLNWIDVYKDTFNSQGSNFYLRVYIDGVKQIELYNISIAGARSISLTAREFVVSLLTNGYISFPSFDGGGYRGNSGAQFELGNLPVSTNAGGQGVAITEKPIHFNNSLRVTIQTNDGVAYATKCGVGYILAV
jgi:hypothetical protein